MPQRAYTLEELQKIGAKPLTAVPSTTGAAPIPAPIADRVLPGQPTPSTSLTPDQEGFRQRVEQDFQASRKPSPNRPAVPIADAGKAGGPGSFAAGMLRNIPSSAGKLATDIGGLVMAIPELLTKPSALIETLGSIPGGMAEHYGSRYGGMENIEQTAYEDPVGMLADVSGVAGLAGLGAKAATGPLRGAAAVIPGTAGRAATGAVANIDRIAQTLQSVSAATDPIAAGVGATVAAGKTAGRAAGKLTSVGVGAATGVSGAAEVALRTPNQLLNYIKSRGGILPTMRGKINEFHVVEEAKKQLDHLRENRAFRYNNARAQVFAGAPPQLSLGNTNRTMAQEVTNFSTRGNRKDLALIVNDADRARAQSIINDIVKWNLGKRTSPIDLDDLKQILDGYTGEMVTDRGHAFSSRIASTVRKELSQNVKGYQQLTQEYAEATELIDDLTKELSLGQHVNSATAARKLMQTFSSPSTARKILVDALDIQTNGQLTQQIAGLAHSSWSPRGIMRPLAASNMGKLAAGAIGGSVIFGVEPSVAIPLAALTAATTSPRIMGELLTVMGLMRTGVINPTVRVVSKAAKSTAAVPLLAGQEERERKYGSFSGFTGPGNRPVPPPPLLQ